MTAADAGRPTTDRFTPESLPQMSCSSWRRSLRRVGLSALVATALSSPVAAQAGVPVHLQLGLPQGEFAQNVQVAGGFGGGFILPLASQFGLRAGLDFMIYGSERRRVPLGGGALGLISVDVTTTNSIFGGGLGAQIGMPGPRPMPYVAGMIGFSAFTTSSSVTGSNSSDEPFASSTNASDNTFAKSVLAGIYLPSPGGKVLWDIGARYIWNGESVSYLTPGDITEDGSGNIQLNPRRTRADLLSITVGVTLRLGGENK